MNSIKSGKTIKICFSDLVCEDASPESVKAQVPDGHDCGVLQDVGSIEEEKDGPGHDHLLAVRDPTFVHFLHEDQLIQTLTEKLLERLLNVRLDKVLEANVDLQTSNEQVDTFRTNFK